MKKVLVIDDDRIFIKLYEGQFKLIRWNEPVELLTALTSDEGMRLAQEKKPDLIFLDYNMKPEHGRDISKKLKTNPLTLSIPIILVTSERQENVKDAIYEQFMGKPIKPNEMQKVVEHYLFKYRSPNLPPKQ